jgi:flagellar L-ring protein FlgH
MLTRRVFSRSSKKTMRFEFTRAVLILLIVVLSACTALDPKVDMPPVTSVKIVAPSHVATSNGSIFQADGPYQPLFEDRKARNVGDTLVIAINEKISATQKSSSSANRDSSASVGIPIVQGLPGKFMQGAELSATTGNKFDGKGETSNNNMFTGTLTATVVEILPNGNMRVAGEKQIGLNHNVEKLRFSGVVNPLTISSGNVVNSTLVADARIDYRGKGYISEAQTMGWLSRFFASVLPF